MTEKKETAEQKLLKIIETQGGAPQASAPLAKSEQVASQVASAVKSSGLPPISLDSILGPLLSVFKGSASGVSLGMREINNVLLGIVVILAGLFVLNIFSGTRLLKTKVVFKVDAQGIKFSDNLTPQVKVISNYLDNIGKRNIFQPYEKKAVQVSDDTGMDAKHIVTMAKNLKLVGISWLDSPDTASAMIEDTQSGSTYFLKVGEKINDVTIKNIYADRVILTFEGEDAVIKLWNVHIKSIFFMELFFYHASILTF